MHLRLVSLSILRAPDIGTYRCGRLRYSRFLSGLHALLAGQLRCLRWKDLSLPPMPRRPVHRKHLAM